MYYASQAFFLPCLYRVFLSSQLVQSSCRGCTRCVRHIPRFPTAGPRGTAIWRALEPEPLALRGHCQSSHLTSESGLATRGGTSRMDRVFTRIGRSRAVSRSPTNEHPCHPGLRRQQLELPLESSARTLVEGRSPTPYSPPRSCGPSWDS